MKNVIALAAFVSLCILTMVFYGCSGAGDDGIETVPPNTATTAAQLQTDVHGVVIGTVPPETEPSTVTTGGPVVTASTDTTAIPDVTAEAGTLTGSWVGTYKNGDYTLTVSATQEAGNYVTVKFSGSGLPGITDGCSLLVETSSFTTDTFGISVAKNGNNIDISATGGIAGYTGTYVKQ